jgi:hypothetical protein
MNHFTIVATVCLISGIAVPLTFAQDHDDLEGTMQVFDDLSDIDRNAKALRRPRSKTDNADDAGGEDADQELREARSMNDDFEHDDIGEDDRERAMRDEHEFEDGEEADYDEFDIVADDMT